MSTKTLEERMRELAKEARRQADDRRNNGLREKAIGMVEIANEIEANLKRWEEDGKPGILKG